MILFRILFCAALFSLSSAAEIFEVDCGQFEYNDMSPYEFPSPYVLPLEVIEVAMTVAKASSLASAVTLSPTSVLQGARLGSLSTVLSCTEGTEFSPNSLPWLENPTQIVWGEGDTRFLKGAVLGNWLALGVIEGIHALAAYRFGKPPVRFPGLGVMPFLFLLTPTLQSSINLLRFGNTADQSLGALSLLGNTGVVGTWVWVLWPNHFKALYHHGAWQSYRTEPDFVQRYGTLFETYQPQCFYFILAESSVNMLSAFLSAAQVESPIPCVALGSILTTAYGVFSLVLVVLHPQLDKIDHVFNSVSTIAQFVALLLGTIQHSNEEMEAGETSQAIAEGVVVSLGYLTLAWTGLDLARWIYSQASTHLFSNQNTAVKLVLKKIVSTSAKRNSRPLSRSTPEMTLKHLIQWICTLKTKQPLPQILTAVQVKQPLVALNDFVKFICSKTKH